jgi:hypothetical protein
LQALPGRTLRQALRTRTTLIPAGGDILALLDRLPPELEHGTPRQSWLDKAPHYAAAIGDRLAPRPPRAIRAGTIPRRSPPRVPVTRPSTARRPRRLPRPPRRRPRRWTALHPLRPLRCRRTAPPRRCRPIRRSPLPQTTEARRLAAPRRAQPGPPRPAGLRRVPGGTTAGQAALGSLGPAGLSGASCRPRSASGVW